MIRRLPLTLLFLLAALPARAEDFTGFYAGVNAGYGWSRDKETGAGAPVPPGAAPAEGRAASALPPSASAAAAGVRRAGRTSAGR